MLDLAFLTDIEVKLNELNHERQERDRNMSHMISAVTTFKLKLGLWSSQLKKNVREHSTNLEKIPQNVKRKGSIPKNSVTA